MRLIGIIVCFLLSLTPALAACENLMISQHIYGEEVCVPANPQRIVTLEPWMSLGMLHELGVTVAGVPMIGIQDQDLRKTMEEASVADIGHPAQPSLERIIALQPDLIIGSSHLHEPIHDKLSLLAPTLLFEPMGWKELFKQIARITGRVEAAEEALEAYEARAAAIRKRLPQGLRVSVVRVAPMGFQLYLDGPSAYAPYRVLREAGVRRTTYETAVDDTTVKRPDWEEISALDGDILLYVVASGIDPGPDEDLALATVSNPLWQNLPAVQSGRAYRVDRATWMGFHGTVSAHRVLDDIERYILAAP